MLATLRVRNFVLIDQLELQLGAGLNVLTGETGAGKSIIVGAITLILGGRASPDVVRTGAAECEVEALFDVAPGDSVGERLASAGVPHQGELVIRRVVSQGGRSRAYLNGRLCTVGELAAIGPMLMDIASQHESVSLTDPNTHLAYLDAFAELSSERSELARHYDGLREVDVRRRHEAELAQSRAQREAFLRFQLSTIEDVDPTPGEEADLGRDRVLLRNADRILDVTQRASSRLERDEGSIADELGRLASEVHAISVFDPSLESVATALDAARSEIVEAAWVLGRQADRVEADPGKLAQIEERLFAIEKLRRQHGPTLDDVLLARDRLRAELQSLETAEERLSALDAERERRLNEVGKLAKGLSERRAAAAQRLSEGITRELAALGMGTARVIVEVAPLEGDEAGLSVGGARLSREGIDRVEFLIAPNKGVEPRPLRKVASGGELSRALLALKRVLADVAPSGAYVFDEVDTGVGGAVAESIGRAMADVARHRQVICVTHLAQIAAFGTTHFVVEKGVEGEATRSTITEVRSKVRVQELARMISGATVTEAARKAAIEMLRAAEGGEVASSRKAGRPPPQPQREPQGA
jgi:DNA repair protein RecN (Recombination protein N)